MITEYRAVAALRVFAHTASLGRVDGIVGAVATAWLVLTTAATVLGLLMAVI